MGRLGISPGALVLCAYSGGADSCALLASLASVAPAAGLGLRAVYVDHGLRPEGELAAEITLVRSVCATLGVPLDIVRIRRGAIAARAAATGIGVEAAAREYRYRALARMAHRRGASAVATAHHADDQAETVLMRLLSGSGPAGLAGMPWRRQLHADGRSAPIMLVRPLLDLARSELDAYRLFRGLPASLDSSNKSVAHRRNALREGLLPALTRIVPGWRASVIAGAEKSRAAADAMDALAGELFMDTTEARRDSARVSCGKDPLAARVPAGPSLDLRRYGAAPFGIRLRALELALANLPHGKPSYRSLETLDADIRKLARAGQGTAAAGGGSVRLQCDGTRLELAPLLDFPLPSGYFFRICQAGGLHAECIRLRAEWRAPGAEIAETGIPEDGFSFPLVVRSRRAGDRIMTADGYRRVDDLLAGWSIPREARDAVPVVLDSAGIVAVLPSALSGRGFTQALRRHDGKNVSIAGTRFLALRIEGVPVFHGTRRQRH